jgi:hypothetical protein
VLRELYGEHASVPDLLIRAATNPAQLDTVSWAQDLATYVVYDFVVSLAPLSAGAALISRGLNVPMNRAAAVAVPGYVTSASDAGSFVDEGHPIPVRAMALDVPLILTPKKLACITSYTRELAAASNIERVIKSVLGEAVALAIDKELFSSNLVTDTAPGGILAGVVALAAKAGGGVTAFTEDIKSLLDALTSAGGGRDVVFVGAPATVAAALNWCSSKFPYTFLASSAIAKNTLIAVEAGAFCSAFMPVPEFSISAEALIHQENTTPLEIVSATGPTTANSSPQLVANKFAGDENNFEMFVGNAEFRLGAADRQRDVVRAATMSSDKDREWLAQLRRRMEAGETVRRDANVAMVRKEKSDALVEEAFTPVIAEQAQPAANALLVDEQQRGKEWEDYICAVYRARILPDLVNDTCNVLESLENDLRREIAELRGVVKQMSQTAVKGERGERGPPGYMPTVTPWRKGAVAYAGMLMYHRGSTWQAMRDTAQTPSSKSRDWQPVAIAGVGGAAPCGCKES